MPEKVDPVMVKRSPSILDIPSEPCERVGVFRCVIRSTASALVQQVQRAIFPDGIQVVAERTMSFIGPPRRTSNGWPRPFKGSAELSSSEARTVIASSIRSLDCLMNHHARPLVI